MLYFLTYINKVKANSIKLETNISVVRGILSMDFIINHEYPIKLRLLGHSIFIYQKTEPERNTFKLKPKYSPVCGISLAPLKGHKHRYFRQGEAKVF